MQSAVLVIVTAVGCGHCNKIKSDFESIRKEVASIGNVELVHVDLSSTGAKLNTELYPSDLQRYLSFFPMAILFSSSEWEEAQKNTKSPIKLNGIIMNANFNAKGFVEHLGTTPGVPSKYAIAGGKLSQWINDNIKSPKFATQPKTFKDFGSSFGAIHPQIVPPFKPVPTPDYSTLQQPFNQNQSFAQQPPQIQQAFQQAVQNHQSSQNQQPIQNHQLGQNQQQNQQQGQNQQPIQTQPSGQNRCARFNILPKNSGRSKGRFFETKY